MFLFWLLIIYFLVLYIFIYYPENISNQCKDRMYLFFAMALLLFFTMFRASNIGNDTQNYIDFFNLFRCYTLRDVFSETMEIGYVFLNWILGKISSNPQILIAVSAIVSYIGPTIFIIKYSPSIPVSVLLFFSAGLYRFFMSGIRQSIAISILFIAFCALIENKGWKFLALVAAACMFHKTALVFLIVYPVCFSKKDILPLMEIGAIILFIFFDKLLEILLSIFPRYSYYVGAGYFDGQIRIATVLNTLLVLFVLCLEIFTSGIKKKCSAESEHQERVCFYLKRVVIISLLINVISMRINIFDRVAMYFSAFNIVYVPLLLKKIPNVYTRRGIYILVAIVFISSSAIIYMFRPDWNHIFPYTLCF